MSSWTPIKLIEWTSEYFEKKGVPSPRVDAELLLATVLKCERIDLYTQYNKPVHPDELKAFRAMVERRATREPLQYIIGQVDFCEAKIQVNRDVLIPRPETEFIVEEIFNIVGAQFISPPPFGGRVREGGSLQGDASPSPRPSPQRGEGDVFKVLDLCTGSGCIAIALAMKWLQAEVVATDISQAALALARENATLNQVADCIDFEQVDLFPNCTQQFDLVVSNPPYISNRVYNKLQEEVRDWEPELALLSGKDGLDIYRRFQVELETWLKPSGWFIGEIGSDQAMAVDEMFREQAWCHSVDIAQDLSGHPRMVIVRKR